MEGRFPKRIFRRGEEPQVDQINNSCKLSLLKLLEEKLPAEYNEVCTNSVFADILALRTNNLGYSARLVHSMLCRQLITTKKNELWFVFGGMPLRFLLQEFHDVTGLNCSGDAFTSDLDDWENDKGFWAEVLKKKTKINILDLKNIHLEAATTWESKDKLRLVYLCVIAGFVLAKDEKSYISQTQIKLVMNIKKVRDYPWGRKSFSLLLDSIEKASESLKNPNYVLNGFSYAFQIWVMEAIPEIGRMLGKLVKDNPPDGPRCTKWTGCCRVIYDQLIVLENIFCHNDVVYPYISTTGNADVFQLAEYLWPDVDDATVNELNLAIGKKYDFRKHVWEIDVQINQDETSEVNAASVDVHETKKRSREFHDIDESGTKKKNTELHDVDESSRVVSDSKVIILPHFSLSTIKLHPSLRDDLQNPHITQICSKFIWDIIENMLEP